MNAFLDALSGAESRYIQVYTALMRYLAPLILMILLIRCMKTLLTFRREPEIWAWLCFPDGNRLPVTHWENVIGRSRRCDIVIDYPSVSRNHAVFTRYDDGSWTVTDTNSKEGVRVNGKKMQICALNPEDIIDIGGVEMQLQPISRRQEQKLAQLRTRAPGGFTGAANLLLLSVFQLLCMLGFLLGGDPSEGKGIVMGFGGLIALEWVVLIFYACISRTSFEIETIAFFLSTMGMAAIATVDPGEAVKQLAAVVLGVFTFLVIGWSLRDLERAKVIRYLATAAGLGFLVITLLFGKEYYGAKNWLVIGGYSLQPSELAKVCFVYAGASTMDRLLNRRNLILFIAYSAMICGCLALMNDFGTALIFFTAFLVIAYLRSGSVGTIGLALTSVGFAGVVILKIAPHALRRFSTWRHIWESPLGAGYQQTRALMCLASGGMLGVGIGKGWMKYVFAADSDMVFATLGEEWGLLVVVMLVGTVLTLALFSLRTAQVARSSFYTIGACTAASILLMQVILNVLGTVDVLPLTGVTFPFVSNGGTSMVASWGLLAFLKAADTRQNASFAVRTSCTGGETDE